MLSLARFLSVFLIQLVQWTTRHLYCRDSRSNRNVLIIWKNKWGEKSTWYDKHLSIRAYLIWGDFKTQSPRWLFVTSYLKRVHGIIVNHYMLSNFLRIFSLVAVNWNYSFLVYGSFSGVLLIGVQTSPRVYLVGSLWRFLNIGDIHKIYLQQPLSWICASAVSCTEISTL